MFKIGDAVFHPALGAGVVMGFEELRRREKRDLYYRIELLGQPGSSLMIPVGAAETIGLRPAIPRSRLDRVWRVLRASPGTLPEEHKARYKLLEEKLRSGDTMQVAEAVRDMTRRQQERNGLTGRGKKIYQRGMTLLAGEIAAARGIALADAEAQIRARLGLSPGTAN